MNTLDVISQINDVGLAVFDPSKRLFWGNILGALLLLILLPGANRLSRLKILFSSKIWFHKSSFADMKIIACNAIFRTLLFSGSIMSSVGIAAVISLLLTYLFGEKPDLDFKIWFSTSLFTLCIFLADDFARFYLHYLQHRIPSLWVFHQTHHSALVLTPLTLMRTHPVDIVAARVRNAVTYGIVTGVFFFFLGEEVGVLDILGTELLGFVFNFLGATLRHSQVWMHFGPLEPWIISPAAHQVHHSSDEAHYDKNFGVCLAIWDKLFGSHVDPRGISKPLTFGLKGSPLSLPEQKLRTLYLQPFVEFYHLWKRKPLKGQNT